MRLSSSLQVKASDEFAGSAGSSVNGWNWQSLEGGGGWGNSELQTYTGRTANVSLDGQGHLRITARREQFTGSDGISRAYTSGRVVTRQAIQYGRIEARISVPTGQGLWPAFWTVGQDIYDRGWPYCGEIDILESVNKMMSNSGTLHGQRTDGTAWSKGASVFPPAGIADGWHTYAVDWAPDSVTWYLDGKVFNLIRRSDLPSTSLWPFSKPHVVQLNLAVGGSWPGSPTSTTVFPATMLVDYVRAYAL